MGQLVDGDVAARADVDVALHGQGVSLVGGNGELHDKDAGRRHVVHIQELALGGACAPDDNLGGAALPGFMKAADQRRDDVAILRVIVVARAIEVGGHDAAVVAPVLAVVALTQFDAGYFGHGVGLVGGLQGAGKQGVFTHRLRGQARVDATAA